MNLELVSLETILFIINVKGSRSLYVSVCYLENTDNVETFEMFGTHLYQIAVNNNIVIFGGDLD